MKILTTKIVLLIIVFFFSSVPYSQNNQTTTDQQTYTYKNPADYAVNQINYEGTQDVKNVILMIGDGMSLMHVYSAWTANKGRLFIENCTHTGLSKTYCTDDLITDSAAGGTAISTGQKTKKGYVAVDSEGKNLKIITEIAKEFGLSTGVIATCRITDATPATFSVHNINRNQTEEIAKSYSECGVDFIAGGGSSYFHNPEAKLNLLPEFKKNGYQTALSMSELLKINSGKVFAPVAEIDMNIPKVRKDQLWQVTQTGLNILSQNEKGFFLMVESSMIDDYGHSNDLPLLMEEVFDFDQTIGKVLLWAQQNPGTLVIVTADHETGGLTLVNGNIENGEIECHFSSKNHSGVMVPVYAFGPKAELFTGIYENTDLFYKIAAALNIADK
jgi:alkaline phosphatase